MEVAFYSPIREKRPIRLSGSTRSFAKQALDGVFGRELHKSPHVTLDDIISFEGLSPMKKYDIAINRIVLEAPIRICSNELICGSATLFDAITHIVPAKFNGEQIFSSISHLTCGFDKALRIGLNQYKTQIDARLEENLAEDERELLLSLKNVYSSLKIWHSRYIENIKMLLAQSKASEKEYYTALLKNLKKAPFEKPSSFREAVQALWFLFAFIRLCGNWPGIGRIDQILGEYLKNDLAQGKLTITEAREILAHFFIKGCEWITLEGKGSGDAQHYQNIVLGGIDEFGEEITNEVTYLVLDILEELPIGDFPIAIRINSATPSLLFKRIAEVIRFGGGAVAVYNEELILKSMLEFGYSENEASAFANDGCWEIQVPGKTLFSYTAIDGFALLQKNVLHIDKKDIDINFESYDQLYSAYKEKLNQTIADFHLQADTWGKNPLPCSVVSFFTDDCIQKAKGYFNGGARYTVLLPHLGSIPDVANSLYAIKKLVFDAKKISLKDFLNILHNNWAENEPLRRYVQNAYTYYGNDNDEVDSIAAHITEDFICAVREVKARNGVLRPAGISTFGRQIDWRYHLATAHGFKDGDILAGNLSPTPGTDKDGATAIIRSHCKCDLSKLTCGTALDIKLDPACFEKNEGLNIIISLMKGFMELSGFFMQIDVINNEVLLEAQKHPEQYQNLAVKISGWSARFVTLNQEWQEMIIQRSTQKM